MTNNIKPTSIAILFREEIYCIGLKTSIEKNATFQVINTTDSKKSFLELLTKTKVHLVIIDNLLISNGTIIERIKSKNPNTKILVLTNNSSNSSVFRLLKYKVNGVLTKKTSVFEIINALLHLRHNDFLSNDLVTEAMKNELFSEVKFSSKEYRFIELCCSNMSYKKIAEKMFISINTIDKYRDKVFKKLKVKSRISLIHYALNSELVSIDKLRIMQT